MVSSETSVTVACSPEVVITLVPGTIEACSSCALTACFFLLRDPITIITPTAPNIRIKSAKFCMLLLEEIAVAPTESATRLGVLLTSCHWADVRTQASSRPVTST